MARVSRFVAVVVQGGRNPLFTAQTPRLNDQALVRRVLAGEMQAARALYDGHLEWVYALCLRLTRDPEAAREGTQDSFVRGFRRLGEWRGGAALSTWDIQPYGHIQKG